MATLKTYVGADGSHRFRLRASNGEVPNDDYGTERDAHRGADDMVVAVLEVLIEALYSTGPGGDATRAALSSLANAVRSGALEVCRPENTPS